MACKDAVQAGATTELNAGQAAMLSQPKAVATVIMDAATRASGTDASAH